jgi:hypothetical protein
MIEAIPPSLSSGFAIICLLLQKPFRNKRKLLLSTLKIRINIIKIPGLQMYQFLEGGGNEPSGSIKFWETAESLHTW